MRRSVVEVEVVLFDVYAVIALISCESEEAFLQDRIAPVPHCQRKADVLVAVADAAYSIFIPAISPRPRVIMRKVFPCRAVCAVVFAHRSPCALAHVGAPPLPMCAAVFRLAQALLFHAEGRFHSPSLLMDWDG